MRIAMITGSYPPDVCGVGDYTFHLVEALKQQGMEVSVIRWNRPDLKSIKNVIGVINDFAPAVVQLQYPTVGFGHSIVPQFMNLLMPCVVTLHEVSQLHILRRLSLYLFTSEYERRYARSYAPWITQKSSVVPIGSSIPSSSREKMRKANEIIYFGLIRPNKGVENVLSLAACIKEQGVELNIRMVGKIQPGQNMYFQYLQTLSKDLPVIWNVALSDNELADLLGSSKIAYMPYPDGASERRSSLLAVLANGIATITTEGKYTPKELEDVVLYAHSPKDALSLAIKLREDNALRVRLEATGQDYLKKFTWEAIAAAHKNIYHELVGQRTLPNQRKLV
jgi:glycosyltransferase involved in cell wall biosynthesis